PAVADADGYVIIPNAALSPNKETRFRAVFDATRAAARPTELLPALNMAASEAECARHRRRATHERQICGRIPRQRGRWHPPERTVQGQVRHGKSKPRGDTGDEKGRCRVFCLWPISGR